MTMLPENLEEFTRRFKKYVDEAIEPDMLIQQVDIDAELAIGTITPNFRRTLARFQPFGPGNMSPVFMSCNVIDTGGVRLVGAGGEHLKMELIQGNKPYTPISAIAFGQTEPHEHIARGREIDVCYTVVENNYQGVISPQLRIKDIKVSKC